MGYWLIFFDSFYRCQFDIDDRHRQFYYRSTHLLQRHQTGKDIQLAALQSQQSQPAASENGDESSSGTANTNGANGTSSTSPGNYFSFNNKSILFKHVFDDSFK
jgi:hypothetical protein